MDVVVVPLGKTMVEVFNHKKWSINEIKEKLDLLNVLLEEWIENHPEQADKT